MTAAPASARTRQTAWPRSFPPPVTRAVFPSRLIRSECIKILYLLLKILPEPFNDIFFQLPHPLLGYAVGLPHRAQGFGGLGEYPVLQDIQIPLIDRL